MEVKAGAVVAAEDNEAVEDGVVGDFVDVKLPLDVTSPKLVATLEKKPPREEEVEEEDNLSPVEEAAIKPT